VSSSRFPASGEDRGRAGLQVGTLDSLLDSDDISRRRRIPLGLAALGLGALIWLPCVHLFFQPDDSVDRARALAAHQLRLWQDPAARAVEIGKLRGSNAEWDFMARTYLVLALSNLALSEPAAGRERRLAQIDRIIDETLRLEREEGLYFFLMSYARDRPFVVQPPRSLFLDGEIALMLGARCMVKSRPAYRALLRERVAAMTSRMRAGPVRCAESYPDECWTFCNTVALAAIRIADVLDGTDHGALLAEWVRTARQRLVDRGTGLLISSFHLSGARRDGPEGSSIWMAAHCLQLVDPTFARDQYRRARAELGRSILGFGYAREWPRSSVGPVDIDSGPVVPLLEASPASSGLALIAAAAFGDATFYDQLRASLDFAAFPIERDGRLRYAASNQVGDAVMLYAMTLRRGPTLWGEAARRGSGPGREGAR